MYRITMVLSVSILCLTSFGRSLPMLKNKLIYIMLDGFRYDYVDLQKDSLPGFSKFLENGVRAQYMSPIFPSISYPDWTTLVTGLYPESHGIVGNSFYDSEDKSNFTLRNAESTGRKKWWTSEPIWATASKANVKTAVILYSRCDVPFDGVTPDFCEPFAVGNRGPRDLQENLQKALAKLQEGYDFIMVYNSHTDNVGHDAGPETAEMKQAIRDLDEVILDLLQKLQDINMEDSVNIIIVSDHGMVSTQPGSVTHLELDDYLPVDLVENVAGAGAFYNIKVKEGHVDEVYDALKEMPGVDVYKHNDIPDELHFKNNKYIHDIILKADIKTVIMKSNSPAQLPPRNGSKMSNGDHGFDPREEKMRAIFFATGPDFKNGSTIPPIKNVDIYPLLTHLLGLKPLPNNGTFEDIKMALTAEDHSHHTSGVSKIVGSFLPLILAHVFRTIY